MNENYPVNQVAFYRESRSGREPFARYLDSVADKRLKAAILIRLARIEFGSFGDCRSVGDGVRELRIHLGAGVRIYFAQQGPLVLILTAGPKRTQGRDIVRAKLFWARHNLEKANKGTNNGPRNKT
ncbi:MAG: type II toxin-antitoxin system RelE/ParE family toxin [Bdellovibrionales bacterium]|nr:type II toxin-antitoxin system RelE/ParE family toxin [Bdellovibrionales bacterium]